MGGEVFTSSRQGTNYVTDWKDIQPRVGFAYQFASKMVVRGTAFITASPGRERAELCRGVTRVSTNAVWGTPYQHVGSVNACVRRLREKLEHDPKHPTYLKTIRGVGYLLEMGGTEDRGPTLAPAMNRATEDLMRQVEPFSP